MPSDAVMVMVGKGKKKPPPKGGGGPMSEEPMGSDDYTDDLGSDEEKSPLMGAVDDADMMSGGMYEPNEMALEAAQHAMDAMRDGDAKGFYSALMSLLQHSEDPDSDSDEGMDY